MHGNLHGRYATDGKLLAEANRRRPPITVSSREFGLHYQHKEIYFVSFPRNKVCGNDSELSVYGFEVARRED